MGLFDVPEVVADNMKDLDIALGHLGQCIESINSVIDFLQTRLPNEDRVRCHVLRTRVEQSWELYNLVEESIEDFVIRHRTTNYGPFRDRKSSLGPFLDGPPGKAWMARVVAVFHAFLAHAESTLDGLVQLTSIQKFDPPLWLMKIDSVGRLSAWFQQNADRLEADSDKRAVRAVKLLIDKLPPLDELRMYRNYVVHEGVIPIRGTVARTPSGYLDAKAFGGRISRDGMGGYQLLDPEPGPFGGFDVARFARFAEWHLLDVTERVLRVLGEGEDLPKSLRNGV